MIARELWFRATNHGPTLLGLELERRCRRALAMMWRNDGAHPACNHLRGLNVAPLHERILRERVLPWLEYAPTLLSMKNERSIQRCRIRRSSLRHRSLLPVRPSAAFRQKGYRRASATSQRQRQQSVEEKLR